MNRTLLLKVKEKILAEPEQFIMDTWVVNKEKYPLEFTDCLVEHDIASCGTAACIGGWACIIAQQESEKTRKKLSESVKRFLITNNYSHAAAELLGVDYEDACRLFSWDSWPHNLAKRWLTTKDLKERSLIAAEVIDSFIAEKCPNNKNNKAA